MESGFRSRVSIALAGCAAVVALAAAPALAQGPAPDPALVEKGAYLARAGGCAACHTAPNTGSAPYAGGYPVASPIGNIFSSNITPSKTHGIGNYSLQDFARAVREGIRADGTHLYPVMPYTSYRGISDADVAALYAYFKLGVKPVDTSPPATELPFPFNVRAMMAGWNLIFAGKEFTPKPGATAEVQRGQYLVEALGHCSACHTPRNAFMGEEPSRFLAGGEVGGWHAPNITSDPISGIGAWSKDEIVNYLKTGAVPGKDVAAGSMAEAVEHGLRYLTQTDVEAIAAYLKTVPPVATPGAMRAAFDWKQARAAAVTSYETGTGPSPSDLAKSDTLDGAVLYNGACASCHGIDGAGTPDHYYPSLTSSATVGATDPANLVLTIAQGVNREGASDHAFMPAFGAELTNAQIASVANYATSRFGNPGVRVNAATVANLRTGGPTPLLVRAAPYLTGAGIAMLVLIAAALALLLVRRRRPTHA